MGNLAQVKKIDEAFKISSEIIGMLPDDQKDAVDILSKTFAAVAYGVGMTNADALETIRVALWKMREAMAEELG